VLKKWRHASNTHQFYYAKLLGKIIVNPGRIKDLLNFFGARGYNNTKISVIKYPLVVAKNDNNSINKNF
jgi:predicted phosphodiesterase